MKFYKVKEDCMLYSNKFGNCWTHFGNLVAGELITKSEIKRKYRNFDGVQINDYDYVARRPKEVLELVEVKKNQTYWCFGCRFDD